MKKFNLTQKVLAKIKQEHIKPKPRWQFTLRNVIIWIISFIALVFGGLATSVVIYMLVNNDWDVYEHITGSLAEFIFVTMPYYWLVFMVVFMLVAHYYLKHTKRGYRYSLQIIVIVLILASTILGALFYNIGMGRAIEGVFAHKVPFYKQLINHRKGLWDMVDDGRIAGEIIEIINENKFRLKKANSREWIVTTNGTITPSNLIIKQNSQVKIIGNQIDEQTFEALIIRPMGVPLGGMFERGRDIRHKLMEHPEIRERLNNPRSKGRMKDFKMNLNNCELMAEREKIDYNNIK